MTTLTPEAYELLSDSEKAKYEPEYDFQREITFYTIKWYNANQVEAIIKKVLERAATNAEIHWFFDYNINQEGALIDKQSILTTPYEDLI